MTTRQSIPNPYEPGKTACYCCDHAPLGALIAQTNRHGVGWKYFVVEVTFDGVERDLDVGHLSIEAAETYRMEMASFRKGAIFAVRSRQVES